MSIKNFISRVCKQTAVYWGNPVDTGDGRTWDAPVEIKCRWQDRKQVIMEDNGEKLISRALVFTNQELDYNGLMYLGTLNGLDSTQETDPTTIDEGVCIIKRFEKIPAIASTGVFLYRAFLTPWLT